jgi:protein-S-isoprenylcysteine O-methyltransferase Ste14
MRATAFEFRFRVAFMFAIVLLGLWAPWIEAWGFGTRSSLLEVLALEVSRLSVLSFTASTAAFIVVASIAAAVGAALRVSGRAWLGSGTVSSLAMHAGRVTSDGPYRYVRNPLYLGNWFMFAAIAFAMPASGALICGVLFSLFLMRLILAEEAFLTAQFGEPYLAYLRTVPRLVPRLRGHVASAAHASNWGRALLSETNAIGILLINSILSWRYNNALMIRAILINFGISLVIKAFLPAVTPDPTAAA